MNDAEILKNFRNKVGLSQPALAEALGVSKGLIASIEIGSRTLSHKLNQKIIDVFGENILHPEVKECLPDNMLAVPFFPDAQAAAGTGEELPLVETKEVFYCDKRWLQNVIGAKPESTIVIKAKGNSMDSGLNLKDDIKDGDLLFVDFNNKEVINNKTYVIQQGNNLRVKKLRKEFNGDLYLVSNNEKEYPVERVAEETTVIGRVMWNCSMENV